MVAVSLKKFFKAEDGIRDSSPSRGLGDVYKRQDEGNIVEEKNTKEFFENPENDRTKLFLSQIL